MADYSGSDADQKQDSDEDSPDEKLLELARSRFKLAVEADDENRRQMLEDLKFAAGDQWPSEVKLEREEAKRPCLTVNLLANSIRNITNDQRQNRAALKVSPVDDVATPETAKIVQGLVRHIEVDSNADIAYDTAFNFAVRGGRGWFRIITDYVSPKAFDQEIRYQRISNPFTVYKDPFSHEPDGSDMRFCFVTDVLPAEEFKEQYPNAKQSNDETFQALGDQKSEWLPEGSVRVAEYFYIEEKQTKLHLFSDGTTALDEAKPESLPKGVEIKQTRDVSIPYVRWCKHTGVEILEKRDWPGQWIPLIQVIGEELDIDGKQSVHGLTRDAKDTQIIYNYFASAEAETIGLAPRAPWVGVAGQFKTNAVQWAQANTKNIPYLEYDPVSIMGQPAPPPERQVFEPATQSINVAKAGAGENIKQITGVYDPTLGRQISDQSGVAIKRLNQQAQTSNYHFIDNLHRSMRHAGRIVLELIPKVYDTPRAVRILHPDSSEEVVKINEVFQHKGKDVSYDMGVGKYDIVMETGPSYATKREEALASMLELAQRMPQLNQAAPDLVIRAMDWDGAEKIADRLKKILPPGLADDDKNSPIPPAAKAQMDQMSKMVQALSQQLHAATDVINTKKMELESREKIEMAKIQAALEMKYADLNATGSVELLKAEIAQIQHGLDQLHSAGKFDATQAHDANQADADRQHQAGMAELGHQHSLEQSQFQAAQAASQPTGGPSPGSTVENP